LIQINKILRVLFLGTMYGLRSVLHVFNKWTPQVLKPSVVSHIVARETLSCT